MYILQISNTLSYSNKEKRGIFNLSNILFTSRPIQSEANLNVMECSDMLNTSLLNNMI